MTSEPPPGVPQHLVDVVDGWGPHALSGVARPASIEPVHDLLGQLWRQHPTIGDLDRMRFETAVIEVAANIVEHSAAAAGAEVTFVLTLDCAPEELTADFADDGLPVDVDLDRVSMPDGLAEGGRGLALVRSILDEFRYHRVGDANRWSLLARRTG